MEDIRFGWDVSDENVLHTFVVRLKRVGTAIVRRIMNNWRAFINWIMSNLSATILVSIPFNCSKKQFDYIYDAKLHDEWARCVCVVYLPQAIHDGEDFACRKSNETNTLWGTAVAAVHCVRPLCLRSRQCTHHAHDSSKKSNNYISIEQFVRHHASLRTRHLFWSLIFSSGNRNK